MNVSTIRIRAAYISADTWIPSASPNWLASIEAIVLPGASRERSKFSELPMIIVTAMVSPMALPRASITPPVIDDTAAGRMTLKIAPQRVVPTP